MVSRRFSLACAAPAYLQLLPPGAAPTIDLNEYLTLLAQRMGMIKRGAEPDLARAAQYLVKWWREEGGLLAASSALQIGDPSLSLQSSGAQAIAQGWGFDFQWQVRPEDITPGVNGELFIQERMEDCIDEYINRAETDEGSISTTQTKKRALSEEKAKRRAKYAKRYT